MPVMSFGVTRPPVASKMRSSSFRRGTTTPSVIREIVAVVVPTLAANSVWVVRFWRRNSESVIICILR